MAFILLLFLATPASSFEPSEVYWPREQHPIRLSYQGPRKVIYRELSRYLYSKFFDSEMLLLDADRITLAEFYKRQEYIKWSGNQFDPPWWSRSKEYSPPIVVDVGETNSVLTTPIFSLMNDFTIKWIEFHATIDFKDDKALSFGGKDFSGDGWDIKATPLLDFTSRNFLKTLSLGIKRIGVGFELSYKRHYIELFRIVGQLYWGQSGAAVEISFSLSRW